MLCYGLILILKKGVDVPTLELIINCIEQSTFLQVQKPILCHTDNSGGQPSSVEFDAPEVELPMLFVAFQGFLCEVSLSLNKVKTKQF